MHNEVPLCLPSYFISVVEGKHAFQLSMFRSKRTSKKEKLFSCLPELPCFQVADYIIPFPVVHINLIINGITVLVFLCLMIDNILLSVVCSILCSLSH